MKLELWRGLCSKSFYRIKWHQWWVRIFKIEVVNKVLTFFAFFKIEKKFRQNERRSALFCLNVNKVSRIFWHFSKLKKISSKRKESCTVLLECKQSFTKMTFFKERKKSRQNTRSSALFCLNVNKVSRIFFIITKPTSVSFQPLEKFCE